MRSEQARDVLTTPEAVVYGAMMDFIEANPAVRADCVVTGCTNKAEWVTVDLQGGAASRITISQTCTDPVSSRPISVEYVLTDQLGLGMVCSSVITELEGGRRVIREPEERLSASMASLTEGYLRRMTVLSVGDKAYRPPKREPEPIKKSRTSRIVAFAFRNLVHWGASFGSEAQI
jgi:hypothetical protein